MQALARQKLVTLIEEMGSQARVAQALDVDRSRVTRWLADEEPDTDNLIKLVRKSILAPAFAGRMVLRPGPL